VVVRYIVRNSLHLDLIMAASYARLSDAQVQGVDSLKAYLQKEHGDVLRGFEEGG
jgi:hypothetical protein